MLTQCRDHTPGGRSVRAVAGPGAGPFGLGVAVTARLHVGSAVAVVVSVPGVVLPIAVLLQKHRQGERLHTSKINSSNQKKITIHTIEVTPEEMQVNKPQFSFHYFLWQSYSQVINTLNLKKKTHYVWD